MQAANHGGTAIFSTAHGEPIQLLQYMANQNSGQPGEYGIPTLFDVRATPGVGIKDLKQQMDHLLKEVDENICQQNMLLYHLVDRMGIVEYLTDSPDELEETWAVSNNKL